MLELIFSKTLLAVMAIIRCVDEKFSKPFKTYLGKDAVYNFINSMIEESKYCSDLMKEDFNKELMVTKQDNEHFKNSMLYTKCWICDNDSVNNNVKVRDHCHITGKYRDFPHRDYNINLKIHRKIPVKFHNLRNYDIHVIVQELGKFNLKIDGIPNGLEKYISFTINNKLSFIGNFQFLSSLLDSLLKNLSKDEFKYLSQENLIITY